MVRRIVSGNPITLLDSGLLRSVLLLAVIVESTTMVFRRFARKFSHADPNGLFSERRKSATNRAFDEAVRRLINVFSKISKPGVPIPAEPISIPLSIPNIETPSPPCSLHFFLGVIVFASSFPRPHLFIASTMRLTNIILAVISVATGPAALAVNVHTEIGEHGQLGSAIA